MGREIGTAKQAVVIYIQIIIGSDLDRWMDLHAAAAVLLLLIAFGLRLGFGLDLRVGGVLPLLLLLLLVIGVAGVDAHVVAVVVDDLGIGDGSGVLDDGSADGIDPLLLLLLRVGNEVHGVLAGGELESELPVQDVLGALHGEARGDGDDAPWDRGAGDV